MNTDLKHNKGYYQCVDCGKIYFSSEEHTSESIYIQQWCTECHIITPQLWIGEKYLDRYLYGDIIFDDRYYEYQNQDKKQNKTK